MPATLFHSIKKGAKDKDRIADELRKKLQSIGAEAAGSSGMVSFSKESSWSKTSGTVTLAAKGDDLEITYTRNSEPTTLSYAAGCIFLFTTLVGVILIWYLYDKEGKEFDSTVQSMFNTL
ncbi:MAG TPA: hypothetical protein PLO51_03950 [Candidatus Micrarchaeota archaeon]|nr:hypothetical protein [Candidatus Micrarchaeota archaeon]